MLAHIGQEKEDCLAFGDGENDIPMFEAVATGIAMSNASERLKVVADEITYSSDEDGIAYMLEKMGLYDWFHIIKDRFSMLRIGSY